MVSGSSGQPGAAVTYPASSKTSRHGSQLLGSSQRPWTKTTGCLPLAFAFSTSWTSHSVVVRSLVPSSVGASVAVLSSLIAFPLRSVFVNLSRGGEGRPMRSGAAQETSRSRPVSTS